MGCKWVLLCDPLLFDGHCFTPPSLALLLLLLGLPPNLLCFDDYVLLAQLLKSCWQPGASWRNLILVNSLKRRLGRLLNMIRGLDLERMVTEESWLSEAIRLVPRMVIWCIVHWVKGIRLWLWRFLGWFNYQRCFSRDQHLMMALCLMIWIGASILFVAIVAWLTRVLPRYQLQESLFPCHLTAVHILWHRSLMTSGKCEPCTLCLTLVSWLYRVEHLRFHRLSLSLGLYGVEILIV
jgi:hypothetical protein